MAEETFQISRGESEKREYPEIQELKSRIEKLESQLEKEKIPEEKERIVKQEIKSYLQELQKIPSFTPPSNTQDEAKEISQFEPSQQIGALISLVFEKSLVEAISVARQLNNPALLDEFHDTLVDYYYWRLIEKKILKF
ncbi:MAG: hypothetical protein QME57_03720 [Patescibacteria group bacterium]|nr:hypothetical protein [Patescibacteria group bacterium]